MFGELGLCNAFNEVRADSELLIRRKPRPTDSANCGTKVEVEILWITLMMALLCDDDV